MVDKEYEGELFIDFLITRDNLKEIIEEYKQEIINKFDYRTLIHIHNKIATSNMYSNEQINNFKEVLNYILKNRFINNDFENRYLMYLSDNIINIKPSYDFYYQEFIEKFNNLDLFVDNNYQMINKKELEETVQFDYLVYKYLTNPFSLEENFDLIINPYFILSINKFLYEKPKIFSDENVKKRTINTLNIVKAYYEENNIKFNNIEYIINLVKLEDCPMDFKIIKEYNMKLLFNKIMYDNRNIDETEYKNIILNDYFIENLHELIRDFKYNKLGECYSFNVKERLEYVLSYILENRNINSVKIKYNEIKFILNKVEFSQFDYFLYNEAEIKYTDFEILKHLLVKIIFKKDCTLEQDMRISVCKDYDVFQMLLSNDELDFDKIEPYYVRSIKKFTKEIPEILDSDKVYERVKKILTCDKVLKKR